MPGFWSNALYLLAAWIVFGWSLLAVAPTPVRWLWKPAVAATEWGHWLAAFSLLVSAGGWLTGLSPWGWAPALGAGTLFLTPLLRGLGLSRGIAGHAGLSVDPSPARPAPLRARDLLHIAVPRMVPARHGYGRQDGIDLTLDLYSPDAGGIPDRPLVLVVHGGSWQSGDSRELTGLNRYLAGAGYAVAALNYRLAPRHRFPAPLEDIASAIRFLEGPGRGSGRWKGVVLLGRSSGGHLALLAAYAPVHPAIRGVLALYPPTDLIWSWQRPSPNRLMDSNGVIRAFLGGSPEEMPRRFEAASPVLQVRAGLPPTLLLHGGRDELVSPIQSRRLARALEGAGAPYVHLELPWGKHGMDANLAGPGGQITLYAVTRFLERLGDGDE